MTFEQFGTLVLGAPERLTNSQLPEEIQLEISERKPCHFGRNDKG